MSNISSTKDLIIVENVEYKISKNGNHNISSDNLELKNGIPFVGYGADTGAVLGVAHKIGDTVSPQYSKEANDGIIVTPLILFCGTMFQAKSMFKNYENDKKRFNKLAAEIQKQKIIDKAKATPLFYEVKAQNQMSSGSSESTIERGKRLALNNGVFKPNDNY